MIEEGEETAQLGVEQPLLERIVFGGKIIVVDTLDKLPQALQALEGESVLGFDTESKPAFQKGESYPTCLIQLSTDSTAVLFRIGQIGLPEELLAILEDKAIEKVGCSVIADVIELMEEHNFSPQGFIEINDIEKDLGICGLKTLSVSLFEKRIAKAQARSNWEAEDLTEAQVNYAAIDAWMGRRIYLELKKRQYKFVEITTEEIQNRELRRKLNKVCPFQDSDTVRTVISSVYDYFLERKSKKAGSQVSQYKLQTTISRQMSDKNISFGRNKAYKVFGTLVEAKCLSLNRDEADKLHLKMRSDSLDEFLAGYYQQVSRVMDMTINEDSFPNLS